MAFGGWTPLPMVALIDHLLTYLGRHAVVRWISGSLRCRSDAECNLGRSLRLVGSELAVRLHRLQDTVLLSMAHDEFQHLDIGRSIHR